MFASLSIHKTTNLLEKILSPFLSFQSVYCSIYRQAVIAEAELAGINATDHLLVVGGGAVPYTAMIMAKYAGQVTIIDCDPLSVIMAKKLLRRLKLDNVKVLHGRGQDFSAAAYSAVFIPLQAEPKEVILENIKKTARDTTKIIIRAPKPELRRFYTPIESLPIKNFRTSANNHITFDRAITCSARDIC